jgi:hypothetical protein
MENVPANGATRDAARSSAMPAIQETGGVRCPKCSHDNPGTAYFCTACHQILIHRCPVCWHEQRQGGVCEKCRTNFALYWEMQLERSMGQESRIGWEKFWARVWAILRVALLPFLGLRGILRYLVARLITRRLSGG